jgi:predicted dehydrogenase
MSGMDDDVPNPPALRVAMVGHGFMGAAHSQAFRVAPRFFDLPRGPVMHTLVGRDPSRTAAAAERWGWANTSTDWRATVADPDIDLVDIVSPGSSHAEIAIAALDAGKHVLCEKPLANTVAEASAMADASRRARERGVFAMVGFTYRRVPAVTFMRDLVLAGRIGTVRQTRAQYLQDWLVDADGPMTWRLDKDQAGSGALGDIGAHAIDAVEFVTGQRVSRVSGLLHTFVTSRPLPGAAAGPGLGGAVATSSTAPGDAAPHGDVTVDDLALITARLDGGAIGSFEATRMATGRKNALRIEISGSTGAVAFDLERPNELEFYDGTAPSTELGFRRILVTEPEHPYFAAWWPTGHTIGYEHGFAHQLVDLVTAIAAGEQPTPSFDDGLHVQRVLDAVSRSSESEGAWREP